MRILKQFSLFVGTVSLAFLTGCSRTVLSPDEAMFTPLQYQGNPEGTFDPSSQYYNPVLPGFYPDPSICRVGDDYYMVNSTFGYYPGIPVWHSTDLVHWEQCGSALYRNAQMPIPNVSIVAGVFAPQITYNPGNGLFYIINTIVGGHWNFYITSEDPKSGVWSDPVILARENVPGIDSSLMFDDDGKAWIVSAPGLREIGETPLYGNGDNAIVLSEFDWKEGKAVGEPKVIMRHGVHPEEQPKSLEGPHLYHVDGKYYLMCAEGGTEQRHSEVVFVADKVDGPYEPCKINPILTQRTLPEDRSPYINCTGHADIVQSKSGQWYAVFLGVEPYEGDYYFNVGRQTFLLPFEWVDGQPVILPEGQPVPKVVDMTPDMKALVAENKIKGFDGFNPGPLWDADGLKDFTMFIRRPVKNNVDSGKALEEEFNFNTGRKSGPFYSVDAKGNLTLSLKSVHSRSLGNPAFVGERLTAKTFSASTNMTFTPSFIEGTKDATKAGLLVYQSNAYQMSLLKTLSQDGKPVLVLELVRGKNVTERFEEPLSSDKPLYLKVEAKTPTEYVFLYSFDGKEYIQVGEPLDARAVSTSEAGGFQGAMVGVYGYNGKESSFNPDAYGSGLFG
ncbi:MAG: glycoside hydrolase family 43 protein [Bacteroidales bacterium]|nr:glycoside hydrolase family 43 protein [Bacteroidales bacterium]